MRQENGAGGNTAFHLQVFFFRERENEFVYVKALPSGNNVHFVTSASGAALLNNFRVRTESRALCKLGFCTADRAETEIKTLLELIWKFGDTFPAISSPLMIMLWLMFYSFLDFKAAVIQMSYFRNVWAIAWFFWGSSGLCVNVIIRSQNPRKGAVEPLSCCCGFICSKIALQQAVYLWNLEAFFIRYKNNPAVLHICLRWTEFSHLPGKQTLH